MPSPTLNLNLPVGGLAPGLEPRFLPKSPLALPAPDGTSARARGASAASCLAAFQFAAFLKAAPCRLLELAAIFDANRAQLHLAPAQTRLAREQTRFARRQTCFTRRQTRFTRRQTRFARTQTRLKRGPARAGEWTPRAWSARGRPRPVRTRAVRFAALPLCDFATLR